MTIVLSEISNIYPNVYKVGDIITGSSSGATATVASYNESTTTLLVNNVSGTFDASNDTVTEPGGAVATIKSIIAT